MKYIFVDFEMNPIDKKHSDIRNKCAREIIEIGAVMLDEDFNEISSYKSFVKPQYNSSIYKKYEELTGITMNMVFGADNFETAYRKFLNWCGELDYEIYAWSDSDRDQIEKEMKIKNYEIDSDVIYMFEHWIDFQKLFGQLVNADHILALEDALNACGISFLGEKHDALYDARNTSLLYIESKVNDVSKCIENIKKYIKTNKNEVSMIATIGELINFSELNLQFA